MLYHPFCLGSILILLLWEVNVAVKEIYVWPGGNDSGDCDENNPCKTIDKGLSLSLSFTSSKINLGSGNYTLKRNFTLTRKAYFSLVGSGSTRHDVQITCNVNTGFSFIQCEKVNFERVTLQKCGRLHNISHRSPFSGEFKAALFAKKCTNLRISEVEISFSVDYAVTLFNVEAFVSLTNSVFADNRGSKESYSNATTEHDSLVRKLWLGGGVKVILNREDSDTAVNVTPVEHASYKGKTHYLIYNCSFSRNGILVSNYVKTQESLLQHRRLEFGSGLSVYLKEYSRNATINITACRFVDNRASIGGGLRVELDVHTEKHSFIIADTIFLSNKVMLKGGGAYIANLQSHDNTLIVFNITNCSFIDNVADEGGGVSLHGTLIQLHYLQSSAIHFFFHRCTWHSNTGNWGAAMYLFSNHVIEDHFESRVLFSVQIDGDTRFESNNAKQSGALYSERVPLIFKDTTNFRRNEKTAVVLDGSTLLGYGHVEFANNLGYNGGALKIYGSSEIVAYPNANVTFVGNTCENEGGALCIMNSKPLPSPCVFRFVDNVNISVIFKDNKAVRGNSIFVSTLRNVCVYDGKSILEMANKTKLNLAEIATDPVDIQYNQTDWVVAPGEVFNPTVRVLDEVHNHLQGTCDVVITSVTPSGKRLDRSSLFRITNASLSGIRLVGEQGSNYSVVLSCFGGKQEVEIKGAFRTCYPGFHFSPETSTCVCMKPTAETRGISRCDSDGKTVWVKQGYWAGVVDGKFVTYVCPTGHCNSDVIKLKEYQYLKSHMCGEGRDQESILCGQCKENYSSSLGGDSCKLGCTNWHLLLLIPFGIFFLVVVMLILIVDLDAFTGCLNAWLFSYHVMKLLTPENFEFNPFTEFLISLSKAKVEFGGNLCVAERLDEVDKLMLMYTVPLFCMLMIILLSKFVRRFPNCCLSRLVTAPFRGVCTILVFCYTDTTNISLNILRFAKFESRTVVFHNGDIECFHGKHIFYGITALAFITVFVIPFPLILIFRPYLTKYLRPVLNLSQWNPYFDTLQRCFKDRYRWCAGFYFISRLGILLIYTFVPTGPVKKLLLAIVCILNLLIFAFLRPYREACDEEETGNSYSCMNILDVSLLTALCFISVFSIPFDNSDAAAQEDKWFFTTALNILSFTPVLMLTVTVALCAQRKCHLFNRGGVEPLEFEGSKTASLSMSCELSISRQRIGRENNLSGGTQTTHSLYGSLDGRTILEKYTDTRQGDCI